LKKIERPPGRRVNRSMRRARQAKAGERFE
jgi:hypothetical protein